MVNTPVYYINNFPTVTGDASSVKNFLVGVGADILIESLSKRLKVFDKPTILNFLSQNVASEFVSQTVEVALNPTTGQFKVNGEVIVDVIGETATDAAVKAILTALGVGTGIVGITIGAVASEWIWDALSEETGGDEAITSFIDDVIQYVRGPVPIDIQIVDTNGNVLAGALYEEDIDETTEYEAITLLIQQSQISSVIPQLAVGANRIRVVEKTIISPQVREYRLYNGALVDEISQTFNISKYNLLFLGTKNEPNWNGQIYAPLLFGESPFLFGSTDHQFFVPLPDTNGNIQPVGLYLGDIIVGTDSEDRLDAFQVFRERAGLDRSSQKQKVLLLGLDGDDIIDGNVDDDFIVGGEGNDTIDGKGGTDIAIFSDDFENYEPSLLADGNTVFSHVRGTQTDGVDTLRGIEFAQFRDQIVLLPLEERSPQGRTVVPALPQLVKDIFPGGNSSPEGLTVFNNKLYFSARESGTGHELWVTDGTDVGTQLVKDINPGVGSSYPKGFFAFNGRLFFTADDGSTGEELWVTDGTAAGTQLLKDIRPGTGSSLDFIYYPPNFTVFNGRLFFTANDGINGRELWSTDGTTAGTQLFKDISPGILGSTPSGMTVINGNLIFAAEDRISFEELWISDGTAAGTQLLKDIATGFSSYPDNFTIFGNRLFFTADDFDNNGRELWVTDGTAAGTQLFKDINPGGYDSSPQSLTVVNDKLFFNASNSRYGYNGYDVWVSDGTAAGTLLTKNIYTSPSKRTPQSLTAFNGKLFFTIGDDAYGSNGIEVWFSDGTAAGTQLLKKIALRDSSGSPTELAVFNGKLFISAGRELWESDGTTAGTQQLPDIFSRYSLDGPKDFTILGDQLLFTATTFTSGSRTGTGTELWKIDVTTPSLTITPTNADRPEGNTDTTPFTFTVTRSGDTSDTSSVQYAVAGSGSSPTNATDFDDATTGSIEFAANQATATITLNVRGDATIEPDEEFTVTLSNPIRATIATATATGIIRDDDHVVIPTPEPIPTPTPEPIPTPTPEPIPTPTPEPIPTPTPEPIPTPTPEPIPTPTPEPIPTPTPEPIPTPTPEPSGDDRSDTLIGTNSNDLITGTPSNEIIVGKLGNDSLFGRSGNDLIYGNQGEDVLNGNQGNDSLYGGKGNDLVHGGKDNDLVSGDLGDDTLFGDLGNDTVFGGEGNDLLNGNQGEDVLNGNQGNDTVYGGKDNDVVHGGKDDDLVSGDLGNDTLFGDLGNDTVRGGAGDDLLSGGVGNDSLIGGEGCDRFVLTSGAGVDTITDFQTGQDLMGLAGGLRFEQLTISQGTGIQAQDTLIHIATTGELLASLTGLSSSSITQDMFALV